jgi:hypothetical protein
MSGGQSGRRLVAHRVTIPARVGAGEAVVRDRIDHGVESNMLPSLSITLMCVVSFGIR